MTAADMARRTTAAALAVAGACVAIWLGPAAAGAGIGGLVVLGILLLPLGLGLRGVLLNRLQTGRRLSLLLPFYGAAVLVAAVGSPEARAWATAAAFAFALAFAATLSWVRRASPSPPSR